MPHRFAAARFRLFVLVGATAIACASCSSGVKKVYPVTGKVYVDGQPAQGAVVFFHPVEDEGSAKSNKLLRPSGQVDADGGFHLTSYKLEDGAPAGKYKVTFYWEKNSGKGRVQSVPLGDFSSPASTPFVVEVKAGNGESNDFSPFNLTLDDSSRR